MSRRASMPGGDDGRTWKYARMIASATHAGFAWPSIYTVCCSCICTPPGTSSTVSSTLRARGEESLIRSCETASQSIFAVRQKR
jgi:hypothetical protein